MKLSLGFSVTAQIAQPQSTSTKLGHLRSHLTVQATVERVPTKSHSAQGKPCSYTFQIITFFMLLYSASHGIYSCVLKNA